MKKQLLLMVSTIILFACTNQLYVADTTFDQQYLSFLKEGVSNRDDIILRLGEPSWSFENGRILTYRLYLDKKQGLRPVLVQTDKMEQQITYAPIIIGTYSLVLVFNDNVLDKHSLLRINP